MSEKEYTEDLEIFWYFHSKDLFHKTETLTRIDTKDENNAKKLVFEIY